MTTQARVDPRPVKPPSMGLFASGNNIVVGGDSTLDTPTNIATKTVDSAVGRVPVAITEGDAADYETNADGTRVRWISGFTFIPELCNGGQIIAWDGATQGALPDILNEDDDGITVLPYIVEGGDRRSTFGTALTEGEAWAAARRQLLGCEQKQIEAELWTGKRSDGSATGNRHLTSNTVDMIEGDRVLGYITAFAALEQAINDQTCGQQGMIHARADTVTLWSHAGLIERVGNLLLSKVGTIVVPGAGYTGSAPDAGTPGEDPAHVTRVFSTDSAWAYATTVVDIRRGAIFKQQNIQERLTTSENTLLTWARRTAATAWGCLHVGVHVDHINLYSTTGS